MSSIFTGEVPNNEITGIVVSTTFIVLIRVEAEFPEESVTSYETVYEPRVAVFTDPEIEIVDVIVLLSS